MISACQHPADTELHRKLSLFRNTANFVLPPDEPLDQERRMFYSANWQLLEEHIHDNRDVQARFTANRPKVAMELKLTLFS